MGKRCRYRAHMSHYPISCPASCSFPLWWCILNSWNLLSQPPKSPSEKCHTQCPSSTARLCRWAMYFVFIILSHKLVSWPLHQSALRAPTGLATAPQGARTTRVVTPFALTGAARSSNVHSQSRSQHFCVWAPGTLPHGFLPGFMPLALFHSRTFSFNISGQIVTFLSSTIPKKL